MGELAKAIKARLTAREVVEAYGFHPDRSGFLQCPFHQGDRHGSLKVYPGDRGWHCFGCGAGGSVIDFVMACFGLSFADACRKLNEDFSLGLTDQRPTQAECAALAKARAAAEAEREAEEALRNKMAEEHRRWWKIKQQFEPPKGSTYLHPLYGEALKRLPYLEWWLDEHMGR